jgi:crotonobetainyl-CoA:carnitine CoA-transferase CaiB-like acyl-CoA transferase
MMASPVQRPLTGLRVLDLTRRVAGPYAGQLFAEYGADVVKVESPEGDPTRHCGPFPGDRSDPEASGLFLQLNLGKRSVAIDVERPDGAALVRRLATTADVVLEDFRPGRAAQLGLDYERLSAGHERLIYCALSNFGQSGPYRDYEATEITFQAMSGFMAGSGDPSREPLWIPLLLAQQLAGAFAYLTTLAAEHAVHLTCRGSYIDLSVHEAMMELQDLMMTAYSYSGSVRQRLGYRRETNHPSTILPCQDGYVVLLVVFPKDFEELMRLAGREDLARDPRMRTGPERAQHADEIDAALVPWLRQHTAEEIYRLCQQRRIPVSIPLTAEQILVSPQLVARGFFRTVDHPAIGAITHPGPPFRIGDHSRTGGAPRLGAHTDDVLGGAGVDHLELKELRERGVIS